MAKLALLGGKPVFKPQHKWPRWPVASRADERRVLEAIRGGVWGLDSPVTVEFAQKFAAYLKVKHVLPVANGTAALELAVKALGIVPGDEVIVPASTFVATATAALQMGATVVFADIDPETFTIDPRDVARRITPRTRAIIPVHLYGNPCDMAALGALARKHGLAVIEDSAHAHGMFYRGKAAGAMGNAGCFSFQTSKNMTCGEGGALVTNDTNLYNLAHSFHSFGRRPGRPWYEHSYLSANERITALQSALLIGQLERLEEQTIRRLENGNFLNRALAAVPGVHPQQTTDTRRGTRRAFHIYSWRHDPEATGMDVLLFLDALKAEGIAGFGGYGGTLPENPMFQENRFWHWQFMGGKPKQKGQPDYRKTVTPVAQQLSRKTVNLLHSVLLGTRGEMQGIVDAVAKVIENADEARRYKKPDDKGR